MLLRFDYLTSFILTLPNYVSLEIKALLRRKNRLMHAERVEEAAAIAKKISDIIKRCKSRLSNINDV